MALLHRFCSLSLFIADRLLGFPDSAHDEIDQVCDDGSYIKKQMQDNNLFKDYTMQQLLDKLDVIECFENPGDKLRVGEVLSKQNQLYLDLGVTPPTPYVETSL